MSQSKLVAMANQIATFFQSYPRERAVEGVAKHINKFWSPNMRKALRAEAEAHPSDCDDLVLAALDHGVMPKIEHAA